MAAETGRAVRRGTNLDRVGEFNDTVVLAAIRRAEERLSRVELAAATGLSGQAISNITRRLLDAGLVREAGRPKGGGLGKPRTLLELEPTGQYAVGVHLDPPVVTVVVDPPNLAAWHLVPLRDALRERTGLPVLLDKDVTAAASAEKWAGGPNGRGSFVFFYLGTGVGAGLVTGTSLGADVGAVGAASLVLDHTFSPNPSVLLPGPALLGTWKVMS
jgi:predicted NBD/HSP70 family sugar kinase